MSLLPPSLTKITGSVSGPRKTFTREFVLDFLLKTRRLDIQLTPDQKRALEEYARTHSKRFAIVLNSFARLVGQGAKIFSVGSMPNHLELLFVYFFGAEIEGSTFSPVDQRDSFTAAYEFPDGKRAEMVVYLRNFTRDKLPVASSSRDAVFCFEALEHFVESPIPLLHEIRRILKPGGYLLISTPNQQHWYRIFHAIHGLTYPDLDYTEPCESRHTHIFSLGELEKMLARTGFHVSQYFSEDPWENARHGIQFDMKDKMNYSLKNLLVKEEYRAEDIFIAAVPLDGYCVYGSGWHEVERDGTGWWRWSGGNGCFEVFSDSEAEISLEAEIYSIQPPDKIKIMVNGVERFVIRVDWELFKPFGPVTLPLAAGNNVIEFVSEHKAITLPKDTRLLAFALKNLRVVLNGVDCRLNT